MTDVDRTEELALLREIARWTREVALPLARLRVEGLVDTEAKKRAYVAMEGGTNSKPVVAELAGVNRTRDLVPWLAEWEAQGIVDRGSNPPKATFSLSELGIAPPGPKADRSRKSAGEA